MRTAKPPAARPAAWRRNLGKCGYRRAAGVELTEPFPERWTDHLLELVGDYVF